MRAAHWDGMSPWAFLMDDHFLTQATCHHLQENRRFEAKIGVCTQVEEGERA